MTEKDIPMHTGYCTHRLYSNENRIIIVPEAYSVKSEEMVGVSDVIETLSDLAAVLSTNPYFKKGGYTPLVIDKIALKENEGGLIKKIIQDKVYLLACIDIADKEIERNSEEGGAKKNAIENKKFFEKILRSL